MYFSLRRAYPGRTMRTVRPSFIREILSAASSPEVLSLAGGLPRADLFPVEPFRRACDTVLAAGGAAALQYSVTSGESELREWIAGRLSSVQGVPTSVDEVLVTTGSQQALDLCGKLFADSGVALENPGYLGATQAFRANGTPIVSIPVGPDGPQPASLRAAASDGVEAYYGMTRFQNPRGGSYEAAAVHRIASEIEETGLYLIEDDPYGELRFDDSEECGLVASHVPDRVIYCGSFSKSVAPSLRIGFIRASKPIIQELERLKQSTDLHTSRFLQLALVKLLTAGEFDLESHLSTVRGAYIEQRDALLGAIHRHLDGARVYDKPRGGMFLWIDLDESTSQLFSSAIKQGVAFVPGEHFYLQEDAPTTGMRLNFSNLEPEKLVRAVRRIAACRTASANCR